jgi:nitrate/nitrite transporter NarK
VCASCTVTAANFSGHYLVENYSFTAVQAGLVSSLMPLVVVFIAPVAGYVLDKFGGQLWVLLACSIVTVIAYLLLVQVSKAH